MRLMMWIVGGLLVLSTQIVPVGCGDGEAPITCDAESCECRDRTNCDLDCVDIAECQPTCTAVGNECRGTCTAEDCEFRCKGAEKCEGLCGDSCYTSCSSVDVCRAETGDNSFYQCTNAGTCAAEIGDGSDVICTNVQSCNVRCVGTCTVVCLVTDTCNVECLEGERTNCGQGQYTCGLECPNAE